MKLSFILILFCTINFVGFAQDAKKIAELKTLGRDSLIKLAIKKLNEPSFNPSNYDRITVKAKENSLTVEFGLSIRFSDNASCYYDMIYVSIEGGNTGRSIQGNCENPKFYKLTDAQKKKIDFVFKSINKSDEIGHIPNNKLDEGERMEITEKLTYYYVEMSDWSTYSHYKIDKGSGKISEAAHKHYAHGTDEKQDYEIIK